MILLDAGVWLNRLGKLGQLRVFGLACLGSGSIGSDWVSGETSVAVAADRSTQWFWSLWTVGSWFVG